MNFTPVLSSVTAAALLWAAPLTQENSTSVPATLAPVPADLTAQAASTNFDAAQWAAGLRDNSLTRRLANHDALLRAADHNPAIGEQLRAWAADADDVGLAFTASLMLRELEAQSQRGFSGQRLNPGQQFAPGQRTFSSPFGARAHGGISIDELFRELESLDPFGAGAGGGSGAWPGSSLQDLLQTPGMQGSQQSSGVRVEVGPDGVKVHIEETVDGESQTQTYEADSLEQLLELHPELEAQIGGATGLQIPSWFGTGAHGSAPQTSPHDLSGGLRTLRPVAPPTQQLGIRMLLPDSRTTHFDGVHGDVGLQVVEVVPGSLAAAIGVEVGDLVIAIDGRTIRSATDVRTALEQHVDGQPIEVECMNAAGKVRVRTWSAQMQDANEGAARRKPL